MIHNVINKVSFSSSGSDLSVPDSDSSFPGGPGLLPHLRQVLPGLQCRAGICGLDLVCGLSHPEDSHQPQEAPRSPQAGQRQIL